MDVQILILRAICGENWHDASADTLLTPPRVRAEVVVFGRRILLLFGTDAIGT